MAELSKVNVIVSPTWGVAGSIRRVNEIPLLSTVHDDGETFWLPAVGAGARVVVGGATGGTMGLVVGTALSAVEEVVGRLVDVEGAGGAIVLVGWSAAAICPSRAAARAVGPMSEEDERVMAAAMPAAPSRKASVPASADQRPRRGHVHLIKEVSAAPARP